jgi:hypothetical protein
MGPIVNLDQYRQAAFLQGYFQLKPACHLLRQV